MDNPEPIPQTGEFDAGPPFVFGFGFKARDAVETSWEAAAAGASGHDWVWLHLNMNNEEARSWINAQADIPLSARNALLAGETRPRATAFDNGVMVNLRGVNLNEGAEPEDMVSIRIWAEEQKVITTRRRRLKAAQDIRAEIEAGYRPAGPGALLARLAAQLTNRIEPFVDEIEDAIDEIEVEILEGAGEHSRPRLGDVRQTAVHVRRFIAPQREVVSRLAQEEFAFLGREARHELRDVSDRIMRLTEDIDVVRERASLLQDQLTDQRAEEMNRNMMLLSVVAAIFLPLGFLTGLLGINVGGMPGADDPAAFWIVVAICAAIGGALLGYFKARDWI